jgi:hypothetical protein
VNELGAYISTIIGRPWGETRENNCWALVSDIQLRFFDRIVPLGAYSDSALVRHRAIHRNPARPQWTRVPSPAHGAIVLMSRALLRRVDEHAGVCLFLPDPLILHVDNPHGVCADDLMQLDVRGWQPEFYLPK